MSIAIYPYWSSCTEWEIFVLNKRSDTLIGLCARKRIIAFFAHRAHRNENSHCNAVDQFSCSLGNALIELSNAELLRFRQTCIFSTPLSHSFANAAAVNYSNARCESKTTALLFTSGYRTYQIALIYAGLHTTCARTGIFF
jgi:hypothetical protein